MAIEMLEIEDSNDSGRIKVIGVGGAGGNAVDHMINSSVQGVEFICANTDLQALHRSKAPHLIRLGSSGLGAGSKPEKGREAAEAAEAEIREMIAGANLLFITAGMGGGTGTGAAPVVAHIAKEMGILTVAVVTKPFEWEGGKRMRNAENGLTELEASVDSLIVVLNDKLLEVYGEDLTQHEAYGYADDVLRNAVGGIAEVIKAPGQINLDFEDVSTAMGEPGKAIMGTATATGPDRARIAAEQAVECPLLDGTDLSGAKALLLLVSGTRSSLRMSESRTIAQTIREGIATDSEPHLIYGCSYDESLGESIRVTIIATGLETKKEGEKPTPVALKVVNNENLRSTGTNHASPFAVPVLKPESELAAGTYRSEPSSAPSASKLVNALSGDSGLSSASNVDSSYTDRPAVWRSNARGTVNSAGTNSEGTKPIGAGDWNIPAFLRKQAD